LACPIENQPLAEGGHNFLERGIFPYADETVVPEMHFPHTDTSALFGVEVQFEAVSDAPFDFVRPEMGDGFHLPGGVLVD